MTKGRGNKGSDNKHRLLWWLGQGKDQATISRKKRLKHILVFSFHSAAFEMSFASLDI
jgi:hypothetical protein